MAIRRSRRWSGAEVELGGIPVEAPVSGGSTVNAGVIICAVSIGAPTIQTSPNVSVPIVSRSVSIGTPTIINPGPTPILEASSSQGEAISGSITLPKPTGTASGDLLVASFYISQTLPPITPPAGWTLHGTQADTGGAGDQDMFTLLYWKAAGGSEPADYTWDIAPNFRYMAGAMARISGANTTTPIHAWTTRTRNSGQGADEDGTGATSLPAITTTIADCLGLGFINAHSVVHGSATITGWTAGPGFDYGRMFSRSMATATTYATAASTVTETVSSVSHTLAIAPSASGTTATPGVVTIGVSIPTPSVSHSASIGVSVISRTVVTPTPLITTSASIGVSLIARSVVTPLPSITSSASIAATLIARTAVIPPPSIVTTASITASLISRSVVTYVPTVSASANVAVSVISRSVVILAPTVQTAADTVLAGLIALGVITPAPTIVATPVFSVGVVSRSVVINAASITRTASIPAALISCTVTTPIPTIVVSRTYAASVIQSTVVVPVPSLASTATYAAQVIALSALTHAPSTLTGTLISAAVVSRTVVIPAPSVLFSTTHIASVISRTVSTHVPAVNASATISVGVISRTVVIPLASPVIGTNVSAPFVASVVVVNAATITRSASISASVIQCAVVTYAPSITRTALIVAATISRVVVTYTPSISSTAALSVPVVSRVAVTPLPTVRTSADVPGASVSLAAIPLTPNIATSLALTSPVVMMAVVIHMANISSIQDDLVPLYHLIEEYIVAAALVFAEDAGTRHPAPVVSDQFDRTLLGDKWVDLPGSPAPPISSGALISVTGVARKAIWTPAEPFAADQWAEATVSSSVGVTGNAGVMIRRDTVTGRGYEFIKKTNNRYDVSRSNPLGGASILMLSSYIGPSAVCRMRLQIVGSILTAYINGALIFTYDTSGDGASRYVAGQPGVTLFGNSDPRFTIDNFDAGPRLTAPVPALDDGFIEDHRTSWESRPISSYVRSTADVYTAV